MKSNIFRLEFQNPIFHEGQNMTVRLSRAWMRRKFAAININGEDQYVRITCEKWANFDDMVKRRGIADHHACLSEKQLFSEVCQYYYESIRIDKTPIYTITFNIEKEWLQ